MLDPKKINEVIDTVFESIPDGLKSFPEDMREHFKASLGQTLAKMDIVTREEFDIQVNVLRKTREKLERLEQQLEGLLDGK